MTIASVSIANTRRLPPTLRAAQNAVGLPEVQQMLRRLAEQGLGVFMPHMHDEQTGEFQPLPDQIMQVESGLTVRFQPSVEIAEQSSHFLPVAWVWRDGMLIASTACEMVRDENGPDDDETPVKHNHPTRN